MGSGIKLIYGLEIITTLFADNTDAWIVKIIQ